MKISLLSATLVVAVGVSALPQVVPGTQKAPALPIDKFRNSGFHLKPLELNEILAGLVNNTAQPESAPKKPDVHTFAIEAAAAQCSNPRVRPEWDSYSNDDRQAFINAIRCLMSNGPSGQFGNSHSRYEDFIALHQTLTPNVHMNAKFVYWHRQFLWTFEQVLRDECGFDRELPWFDETRYSGRFAQSSLLSSQWFGTANQGGNCVDNGQFANLALNIGPGTDNTYHCLSRNLDEGASANTNQQVVDGCNAQSDFAQMASCSELSAHAWGHNCIGGVMEDVASSVGDPLFWMHHGFIDRNFRIWQNADPNRLTYVDGVDHVGNPLTLDTTVNVYDIRPTVTIRDLIDTKGTHLCYKYQY